MYDNKFYNEVSKIILRELIDKYYMKNRTEDKSPNMESLRIAQENSIYHFEYLSHLISSRSWIAGDAISQADIAAATHISCLDYLNKIDWDLMVFLCNKQIRIVFSCGHLTINESISDSPIPFKILCNNIFINSF